MNLNTKNFLSQFWTNLQNTLFSFLHEELPELTPKLEQVIRVLEFIEIDQFITSRRGFVGRPPKARITLARAFVAKAAHWFVWQGRGEKIEFLPYEAQRYKTRSQAERVNVALQDNHGGLDVRVKGAAKVYTHLMFRILVIAAEQILRLVC